MEFYLLAVSIVLATVACKADILETRPTEFVIQHTITNTISTPEISIEQNPEWVLVDANQLKLLLTIFNSESSGALLHTVTTKPVVDIVQYVQTTTISVADWEFVFNQLDGKKDEEFNKLLTVGTLLSFGSPKLIHYTALLNYLQSKHADPKVAEVLNIRQPTIITYNYDPLIQNNRLFNFLKLEQQLLTEFKLIIGNAIQTGKLVNHPLLDQIQWNVLWELNYEAVHGATFPLHALLNQTVVENWSKVNLTAAIEQLESIPNKTENDKVKKLQWYIALLNGANIRPKSGQYLSLVLSFEDFVKGLTFGSGNNEAQQTISNAQNAYHGCIKSLLNRPNDHVYSIQNRRFGEYLYIPAPNAKSVYSTMPKDKNKSSYRPVFTWRLNSIVAISVSQFKWNVIQSDKRFWIKSVQYSNLYLNTGHPTHVHLVAADSLLPQLASWFVPSDIDPEACYIQNYDSRNTIYAGSIDEAEDDKRRTVFSNGDNIDRGYLWYIKDYKSNIVKLI